MLQRVMCKSCENYELAFELMSVPELFTVVCNSFCYNLLELKFSTVTAISEYSYTGGQFSGQF